MYNITEGLGINHVFTFLIESQILSLFTKAKGDDGGNAKNLEAAKKLAAAVKKASTEEWNAKKALHDKVAAAEFVTTKSLITLAGGDAEKAQEVKDKGYKLGELIAKWGGTDGFISAEEFGPIKQAQEVEDGVDQAIIDAEKEPEGETEKTSKQLADDFIADNEGEGFKVVSELKIKDA